MLRSGQCKASSTFPGLAPAACWYVPGMYVLMDNAGAAVFAMNTCQPLGSDVPRGQQAKAGPLLESPRAPTHRGLIGFHVGMANNHATIPAWYAQIAFTYNRLQPLTRNCSGDALHSVVFPMPFFSCCFALVVLTLPCFLFTTVFLILCPFLWFVPLDLTSWPGLWTCATALNFQLVKSCSA